MTSHYGSIDDTFAEIEVEIGSPSPADVLPGHTDHLHLLPNGHYFVLVGGGCVPPVQPSLVVLHLV